MMKKLFTIMLGLVLLSSTSLGTTLAQSEDDLFDLLDQLADAGQFGYDENIEVEVESFDETSITIQSPVLTDDLGVTISNYTIQYANRPILELIEENKVNEIRQKEFSFDPTVAGDITMTLVAGTDFDPNTTYYLSVVPKNNEGFPGNVSNELSFQLSEMLANGPPPDDTAPPAAQNQPVQGNAIDMCAANISYVQQQNKVDLTWTAITDKNANIYIRHTTERDYSKLGTVNITAEKYTFVAAREGTHFVKIEAIDEQGNPYGTECIQTLHLAPFQEPQMPIAPTSGPEHIAMIIALVLATAGYIAYRKKQLS